MVLAGRADNTAGLWDVATGQPLGPPLLHRSVVSSVAFRGDGRMMATGDDQAAHLWDAPEEVAGDPARLLLWAEVITNQQFDAEGDAIRLMDAPTWDEHRRRLTNRQGKDDGSPPAHGDPTFASRRNFGPEGQARGGLFLRLIAFTSVHP
jgi:WD40 repeat protein